MSKDRIPRLVPGTQLYKYQLVRHVGRGSFGEVWLAHDRAIGRLHRRRSDHRTGESKGIPRPASDIYQVGLTLFRMLVGIDALRLTFTNIGEQAFFDAVAAPGLVEAIGFPAHVPDRLRRLVKRAAHPDPSRRFVSANQMRQELEKLTFPGYWTVDEVGGLVGKNGAYAYRVEKKPVGKGRFDVQATRRKATTGRENRCRAYCHAGLTGNAADRAVERFVKAVVQGI